MAVGIVVAVILILCAVGLGVYFLRKHNILGIKTSNGVMFDNPTFFHRRQPANDTLQIIANEAAMAESTETPASSATAAGTAGWKQESLHANTTATEVAPTVYEELRLGAEGAGFKRFR